MTTKFPVIFLFCLSLSGSVACAQQGKVDDSDQRVLAALASAHSCRAMRFPLEVGPHTQLSDRDKCTLVSTAFGYVAQDSAAHAGMSATDTNHIQSARIHAFAFENTAGGVGSSYWTVEFQLPSRSSAIVVRIDRKTGKVSAGRGEGSPE